MIAVSAVQPWAWAPHPVLWAGLVAFGSGVALLHRRLLAAATHPEPWPRVRIRRFVGSLVVALVALGWPLGDLAAHWSLSALVLQRCVLVLAVASLLLSGLPDDVLAWATRPAPIDALLLRILWPPAAIITVTVVLVGSMAPPLVVAQAGSAVVRGALAVLVTAAGIVLWLPILGRVPGIPRPRPMIRAVYLVGQAIVPVFLSFVFILAPRPLYASLDHTRHVIGLSPLADQQIAGFASKLSFLLTLLVVAGVILARAPDSDEDLGPEDPLVWSDIERHFERADRRRRTGRDAPPAPPGLPAGLGGGAPGPGSPGPSGAPGGSDAPGGATAPHDVASGPPGDDGGGRDGEPPTE